MEPSTPPARRAVFPNTPATPRLGTWYDSDQNQRAKPRSGTPHRGPAAPGDVAGLLTPVPTPHRRTPGAVKGSGRQGRRLRCVPATLYGQPAHLPTTPTRAHRPVNLSRFEPAVYLAGPKKAGSDEGMWYVFRGKRVFRPFPEKQPALKPQRLFAECPARTEPEVSEPVVGTTLFQVADSEGETDLEP